MKHPHLMIPKHLGKPIEKWRAYYYSCPRMVVKAADGRACSGPVTYRQEYGLFSEDSAYILDLGNPALQNAKDLKIWKQLT